MTMRLLSLIGLATLMLVSSQSIAQESTDSRILNLEETVRVLEQRVAALEAQIRKTGTPTRVAAGKSNWRGLQTGMKEGDVEQLLGSPSKIDVGIFITNWYYGDHRGGSVEFDTDARRVRGWREPEP